MLTRTIYLSLDPYQWGRRINGVEAVGDVCHGRTVSQVVQSNLPDYQEGDFVFNTNGWQEYGLTGDGISVFNYMFPRKIDPAQAPISTAVGVMGMLGLTAYSGMVLQCAPQAGETVVVSAASGAVGSVVGQLAKAWGCRAVGIAGGKAKCDYVVKELGFDACVDYKAGDLLNQLKAACPKGVDANFENVGGEILDTVLRLMNVRGRIAVCGLISDYNAKEPYGVKMFRSILVNRLKVQGMIVFDWQQSYPEANQALLELVVAGKLKYRESVVQGIENAPKGLIGLLKGENFGKQLVKLG
jgi:hypothetical protein